MAINRHRDTVVETHTHTLSLPDTKRNENDWKSSFLFECMPVFPHEDDDSSLCPSV